MTKLGESESMVKIIDCLVNMYVVLKIRYIFYSKVICMAQWLSWLERRPVTAEVVSSSLIWVVTYRKVCTLIEYVGS